MESVTHMVAHSQTNPPLLLHPSLPTLNFQLSIRFPAPHSYTFLLLTFTALPSDFSTLLFPFNLLSLTLHYSAVGYFAAGVESYRPVAGLTGRDVSIGAKFWRGSRCCRRGGLHDDLLDWLVDMGSLEIYS